MTDADSAKPLSQARKLELLEHHIVDGQKLASGKPQPASFFMKQDDERGPYARWKDDVVETLALIGATDWKPVVEGIGASRIDIAVGTESLRALKGRIRRRAPLALSSEEREVLGLRSALLTWGDYIIDLSNGYGRVEEYEPADHESFVESLPTALAAAVQYLNATRSQPADAIRATVSLVEGRLEPDSFTPSLNAEMWHAGWALFTVAWWLADATGNPLTIHHGQPCCNFKEAVASRAQLLAEGEVTCPRCSGAVVLHRGEDFPAVELPSSSWQCAACSISGYFPVNAPAGSLWSTPLRTAQGESDAWLGYPEEDAAELMCIARRKAFDRDLEAGVATASERSRLALLMLDVDHFKGVNDSFGHPVGDKVLVVVADIVRAAVGRRGRAYRYGGEEIAVLLPDFTADEAVAVAERIRRTIEAHNWASINVKLCVTLSIGVAEAGQAAGVGELVAQADAALYSAKHGGRNRVCVAGSAAR